jgi:membrane-associated protein
MDIVVSLLDIILHVDKHLAEIMMQYGTLTYAILALIIFCETGLVVMPFLPGDSLLFAAGALVAATGVLNPHLLVVILIVCAVIGDAVNYHIGKTIGTQMLSAGTGQHFLGRYIKPAYITKTHEFYERHGGKTIILARFVPIIRTFAPFVAGIGTMSYRRFFSYNVIGGIVWVASFVYLGVFFGNLPIIKKNFSVVIVAIIILSILPGLIEFIRAYRTKQHTA